MAICERCGDKGVGWVIYPPPKVSDLAACSCKAGQVFRKKDALRAYAAMRGYDVTQMDFGTIEKFEKKYPEGSRPDVKAKAG